METRLYFAFGSNLSRDAMARRCPDSRPVAPAILDGWRLTFQGVADIEPQALGSTPGAVWKISGSDLERLDRYEGYPALYIRKPLAVRIGDETISAVTYVMRDRDTYRGLPSREYLATIRQGYEDWGLPTGELDLAVDRVRQQLAGLGFNRFEPDGPKRLRPV